MARTTKRLGYQRWLRIVYTNPRTGGFIWDWWDRSDTPADDDRIYATEAGYLLRDHPGATILRIDILRVRTVDGYPVPGQREDPDIVGRYHPGPDVHPIDPYPHLAS